MIQLQGVLPEKYETEYFLYSLVDSFEEMKTVPLKKLVLRKCFRSHDNWVDREFNK